MDVLKFFKELRKRKGLVLTKHINGIKFPHTITEFNSDGQMLVRHLKRAAKGTPHVMLYSHPTKRMTVGNTIAMDGLTRTKRPALRSEL